MARFGKICQHAIHFSPRDDISAGQPYTHARRYELVFASSAGDSLLKRRKADEMEKQTLTVAEAARVMGIGLTKAYESVRSGRIPSVRFGRKYLIPRGALARMLESETRWAASPDRGRWEASSGERRHEDG